MNKIVLIMIWIVLESSLWYLDVLDDCNVCDGGNADIDACGDCFGGVADTDGDGQCDTEDLEPNCATNDTDDCGICSGDGTTCVGSIS